MTVFLFLLLSGVSAVSSADAGCVGGGKAVQPARSNALLQAHARKAGDAAFVGEEEGRTNVQSLRAQSLTHLQTLSELMTGNLALPGTVKNFIDTIKNHSAEIKAKLSDEHSTQSGDLDTKFNAMGACDTTLSSNLGTVEGNGLTTAQSLAAAAKASLCACRKLQAEARADAQGCKDQLDCYDAIKVQKLGLKNAFLLDTSGQAVEMYSTSSGTDMCANSGGWQSQTGTSNDDKALAWFASQKTTWENHWDGKKSTLEGLISSYNLAKDTHDSLKFGTGQFAGQGCDTLNGQNTSRASTCTALQTRATMNQCYYHSEKKDKCDTYTQCRQDAEGDWTTAKTRETTDSADRKAAWVAASKIECFANMFSEDASGTMQIDDSTASTCAAKTCDGACTTVLDLTTSLARTISARVTCTLPAVPCAASGWSPTCSAAETSNWGTHTPPYLVGTRTAPTCGGTPAAVNLASQQATETCHACSGLANWNTLGFTPFTPAPTPAPPPAPTPTQVTTKFCKKLATPNSGAGPTITYQSLDEKVSVKTDPPVCLPGFESDQVFPQTGEISSFSVEFDFKPDCAGSPTDTMNIMSIGPWATPLGSIGFITSCNAAKSKYAAAGHWWDGWVYSSDSDANAVRSATINDGSWHTLSMTWDGTTRALCLDGDLVKEDTPPSSPSLAHTTPCFGHIDSADSRKSYQFAGSIRNFRAWDGAMDAA